MTWVKGMRFLALAQFGATPSIAEGADLFTREDYEVLVKIPALNWMGLALLAALLASGGLLFPNKTVPSAKNTTNN